MNHIIANKRLKGVHLNLLSELFKNDPKPLVNREFAHLLGLPGISWHKMTSVKEFGMQPIKDVHLSILLRFVLHNPTRLQRLVFPDAKLLKAKCERSMVKEGALSDRLFSLVLARQVACGHRWIKVGKPWDATTARLALVLEHFLDKNSNNTLEDWMRRYIHPEARRRGINPGKMTTLALPDDVKELSIEEQDKSLSKRLFLIHDLREFPKERGLEPSEIGYVVGLHQNRWSDLMSRPLGEPIADASLCIFLRYLIENPDALRIFRLPKVDPIDAVKAFRKYKAGTRYTDQQIIALTGLFPYILHRNNGINTPKFRRVLSHFIGALEGGWYDEWVSVVDEEARTRGIKGGIDTVLELGWKEAMAQVKEPDAA